jgi:hypothetical protein
MNSDLDQFWNRTIIKPSSFLFNASDTHAVTSYVNIRSDALKPPWQVQENSARVGPKLGLAA